MKKTLILSAVLSGIAATAHAGPVDTLALWTFEQSVPTNAGPHAAEGGVYGGNALGSHASASTVYSNPVGNGSLESFSANNWDFDDYFQFTTSTTGYQNIMFGWSQTRSGTGPVDFAILWSADGVNFQSLFQYSLEQISWSSAMLNPASVYAPVALPPEAANLSTVWVRILCEDSASPAGTSRVDDVFFSGMAVPAPGVLALMALAGVCGPRRRRA